MNEFLKNIIGPFKKILDKMSMTQKLITGGVILAAIVVMVVLFVFTSRSEGIPLFTKKIEFEDMGRITKKLDSEGVQYSIRNDSVILLKNKNQKNRVIMMLSQDGLMPKGRYSFLDILESKKLTSSKFENNIKFRAALEGKLEELLASSEYIDEAEVSFTMPEQTVFVKERSPVKVAVLLTPSYNVDLREHKGVIKGIEELVANSIDRATVENIVITDKFGIKLNDFSEEDDITAIKITKENLKIRDKIIQEYREKCFSAITNFYSKDRVSVLVDVQMNFDKEKEERTEILPVVLKEDNPETPYDDGERVYSITESSKITTEEFKGPNWIPEGPPGFDDNVPPGYKGALEQMTEYVKNENIKNEVFGEAKIEKIKDPWDISKITTSVTIDGTWKIEYDEKGKPVLNPDGTRKREFIPESPEKLRKIKAFLEQGIGYSVERGDKVVVEGIPFDRVKQFAEEDAAWKRKQQTTLALIAGLIALIFLIIATIIYRLVAKELERRKRLREEELARQHQLAREMALKSAEEEATEIEMSLEDKARLEMQENAINLAREHPEDVAQLIRTWLTEE